MAAEMSIVTIEQVARLWGQLVSLRIDIELLQIARDDPDMLRDRKLQALQVELELRAACGRMETARSACGRALQ